MRGQACAAASNVGATAGLARASLARQPKRSCPSNPIPAQIRRHFCLPWDGSRLASHPCVTTRWYFLWERLQSRCWIFVGATSVAMLDFSWERLQSRCYLRRFEARHPCRFSLASHLGVTTRWYFLWERLQSPRKGTPFGRDAWVFTLLRRAASMPGFHSPPGERVTFLCLLKEK